MPDGLKPQRVAKKTTRKKTTRKKAPTRRRVSAAEKSMMAHLASHSKQAKRALVDEVSRVEAAQRATRTFVGPVQNSTLPAAEATRTSTAAGVAAGAKTATKAGGLRGFLKGGKIGGGIGAIAGLAGADLLANFLFGGETAQVVEDTGTYVTGGVREQIAQTLRARAAQNLLAAKAQRLKGDISANIESLRQSAPDVYQQLIAGRRLPEGAVVFGGGARTDLLERVAMQMSQGQFSAPPNARVRLEGSLQDMNMLNQDNIRATISSNPR